MVLWMEAWSRCSQLHSSPGSNACGVWWQVQSISWALGIIQSRTDHAEHKNWAMWGISSPKLKARSSSELDWAAWVSLQPKAKGSLVLLHRFSLPISQFWLMAHLLWPHPPPLELGMAGLLKISPMVWSNQPWACPSWAAGAEPVLPQPLSGNSVPSGWLSCINLDMISSSASR